MLHFAVVPFQRLPRLLALTLTLLCLLAVAPRAQTSNVVGWGDSGYGQIGNNGGNPFMMAVFAAVPSRMSAIAAGKFHTLALKPDGTVWAWGDNSYGDLGDGTTNQRHTPVQVLGPNGSGFLTGVQAIAAGYYHTVALKADGTVWTWGSNDTGELGDGTKTERHTPVQVAGPNGVGYLTGVTAIAAGYGHTVALKSDGTVWTWGYNIQGQLGDGSGIGRLTPVQVKGLNRNGFLTDVTGIAAGDDYTLALKLDGSVWAWGNNAGGQLGNGTTTLSYTPVQVLAPNGAGFLTDVQAITAGAAHIVALKSDGTVWTWGLNEYGQLGDGTTDPQTTPVQVVGPMGNGFLTSVKAIAAGDAHTAAAKADGSVWTWGYDIYGQLDDGGGYERLSPVQARGVGGVGYLTGVIALAAGSDYTVALLAPTSSVSGTVTLEGCAGPKQSLTFAFRPTDGSAPFTRTQTLGSDGSFAFANIPSKSYNLAVKGAIWLQKVVALDATSGNVSGLSLLLPAGDANNDNSVDILDFSVLVDAYNSMVNDGTGFYDARADFTCDGSVDLSDFGLLINNYGSAGDL